MKPEVFCGEIYTEFKRARQHHAPMHSFHEGYAIILEEVDELKDTIWKDRPWYEVQKELIQISE